MSRIEKQASKHRIIAANILRVPIATCKFDPNTNSGSGDVIFDPESECLFVNSGTRWISLCGTGAGGGSGITGPTGPIGPTSCLNVCLNPMQAIALATNTFIHDLSFQERSFATPDWCVRPLSGGAGGFNTSQPGIYKVCFYMDLNIETNPTGPTGGNVQALLFKNGVQASCMSSIDRVQFTSDTAQLQFCGLEKTNGLDEFSVLIPAAAISNLVSATIFSSSFSMCLCSPDVVPNGIPVCVIDS